MRPPEVLELVNSMIEGTVHQKKLIEWKKIHKPQQRGMILVKLGLDIHTFMRQNAQFMDSKYARRYALDQSEWLRPEYLEGMYDATYTIFFKQGLLKWLRIQLLMIFMVALSMLEVLCSAF